METMQQASSPPPRPTARLTQLQKLIIGYATLTLFILAALFFSADGLYSLKKTAQAIATSHLPAMNSLTDMRNSLIDQEGYAGKYAIFKSSEFRDLFRQREKDFLAKLTLLEKTGQQEEVAKLETLYAAYRQAAGRRFASDSGETSRLGGEAAQGFSGRGGICTAQGGGRGGRVGGGRGGG